MRNILQPGLIAFTAALFTAAAPTTFAQIYKWTNDDGTTTFSNAPPADQAATPDFAVIVPDPPRVEAQAAPGKAPELQAKTADPAVKSESEAPRAARVRSLLPQAVQDPCLRSSDRYCHQKHSAHYRPYVGYSPTREAPAAETSAAAVMTPTSALARGASATAASGGTLSGGTR